MYNKDKSIIKTTQLNAKGLQSAVYKDDKQKTNNAWELLSHRSPVCAQYQVLCRDTLTNEILHTGQGLKLLAATLTLDKSLLASPAHCFGDCQMESLLGRKELAVAYKADTH